MEVGYKSLLCFSCLNFGIFVAVGDRDGMFVGGWRKWWQVTSGVARFVGKIFFLSFFLFFSPSI